MNPFVRFIDSYVFTPMGLTFLFGALSWVLILIGGGPMIGWLKHRKGMKWAPREDTPDSHAQKAGTPSMGGIGIIGAALVGYLGVLVFAFGVSLIESRGAPK